MKITVYTVAKNEELFAERFYNGVKDADEVVVLDTGSTDKTVKILRDLGARVITSEITPWRFDTARNLALGLVNDNHDLAFSVDLDEIPETGWRNKLEYYFYKDRLPTKYKFTYVWSHRADGSPATMFWYDKIHTRHDFYWKNPVHEILLPHQPEPREVETDIVVHHYPDLTKSRANYLELLELAVSENPDDDRSTHYLGREYMFNDMWEPSIRAFHRHLTMPTSKWEVERATSYRYMARCFGMLSNFAMEEVSLLRACSEAPMEREVWIDLGKFYLRLKNWEGGLYAAKRSLSIEERPLHYMANDYSWNEGPYDIMSVCSFYLGLKKEALELVKIAKSMAPFDDRIDDNVRLIEENM